MPKPNALTVAIARLRGSAEKLEKRIAVMKDQADRLRREADQLEVAAKVGDALGRQIAPVTRRVKEMTVELRAMRMPRSRR